MRIPVGETSAVFECSDGTRKLLIVFQGIHKEHEEVSSISTFQLSSGGTTVDYIPKIFNISLRFGIIQYLTTCRENKPCCH